MYLNTLLTHVLTCESVTLLLLTLSDPQIQNISRESSV